MKYAFLIFIAVLSTGISFANDLNTETSFADGKQKAVLVTGASSGIGKNIAETLAAEGYYVYAGARKQRDLDALSAIKNIQGIRLDVTVQKEIDEALETIKKQGRGLYGLVNNAGVFLAAPLIEISEQDMRFIMDVNLFGPYRVTKAFAPLIIQSKGRITSTGSIAAFITSSLRGPYSMSKAGMEIYTDALATELKKFDVQVSIIEPGSYNSQIMKKMHQRMQLANQTNEKSLYQEEFKKLANSAAPTRSHHKSPDEVSAAVMHALFSAEPKRRYMVVPNQLQARVTIQHAMQRLVQLNQQQPFSYSREELISTLDKILN